MYTISDVWRLSTRKLSRRAHDYKNSGVHFLIGGTQAIDRWESFPVLGSSSELSAEEPLWWVLPDDNLMALFRDNRRSGYLFRSFSVDNGRSWSKPVRTNFPDATSKMTSLEGWSICVGLQRQPAQARSVNDCD